MSASLEQSVRLAEGNLSLRVLMQEVLEEEGFELVDGADEMANLLVADVDSERSEEFDELLEAYRDGDRPVLLCGLRGSRDEYSPENWLNRPFDAAEFLTSCRSALGLETDSSFEDLEMPDDDEPTTREVDYDSEEMEEELGEGLGSLVTDAEVEDIVDSVDVEESDVEEESEEESEAEEESDVVEIDDASGMVLDVQEIDEPFTDGGSLSGDIESRALDISSLQEEAKRLEPASKISDPRTNPTLPDVPTYKEDEQGGGPEESSGLRRADSTAGPKPGTAESTGARRNPSASNPPVEPDSIVGAQVPAEGGQSPAAPGSAPTKGEKLPGGDNPPGGFQDSSVPQVSPQFEHGLSELATLLAESWNRIGLTARWEDRAERLKRTFDALLDGGLSRASDELERVPPAHGLSGTLQVFPSWQLIRLIRERELIGRLEISNESGGFVLYFDSASVVGVDDLQGRSEAMLLDCLREIESVDEEAYRDLSETLEDSFAAPLEMRLRSDGIVTESQLLEAREARAKWVMKEVLAANVGTFAFIHGNDESGQPWPVNELDLNIDVVMLDLVREGKVDHVGDEIIDETLWVTIPKRLEAADPSDFTVTELSILDLCVEPTYFEDVVESLEGSEDELRSDLEKLESVGFIERLADRIVERSSNQPKAQTSDSEQES